MAKNVVLFFTLIVLGSSIAQQTPQCQEMIREEMVRDLTPCLSYLTADVNSPNTPCCIGVQNVHAGANSRDMRQSICVCLKEVANGILNLNDDHAAALPGLCGVKLNIPISKSTDCTKIT
ncbi:non-specific lipid-transfer protein 3 [Amborella trichopoda]|nr:non-specific lipid-transfer protein 3 [Amborella trichopoda]|eukprot:XP_006847752.2 non-specific lipid-transfer protein 3 [Amborella trichopoda]